MSGLKGSELRGRSLKASRPLKGVARRLGLSLDEVLNRRCDEWPGGLLDERAFEALNKSGALMRTGRRTTEEDR